MASNNTNDKTRNSPRKSLLGIVAPLLLVFTMFSGGMYLFLRMNTTVDEYVVVSLWEDTISIIQDESITNIPVGKNLKIFDSSGTKLQIEDVIQNWDREKIATITVAPNGEVSRIVLPDGDFVLEGELTKITGNSISLGKTAVAIHEPIIMDRDGSIISGVTLDSVAQLGDCLTVIGKEGEGILIKLGDQAGELFIDSNFEGARVLVDGQLRGKTPCRFNISPGSKKLEIKADGHYDYELQTEIRSLELTEEYVNLVPVTGILRVTSSPTGAEVYNGTKLLGETPLETRLPPGQYEITVSLDGYYPKKSQVLIIKDREAELDVPLYKIPDDPFGFGGPSKPDLSAGQWVKVLDTWPSLGILEVVDSEGQVIKMVVSAAIALYNYPSGKASWSQVLPGEELNLQYASDGTLNSVYRTYTHKYSVKGNVFSVSNKTLVVGDKWSECLCGEEVIVRIDSKDVSVADISVGDSVICYGESPGDIRYIVIESTLGIRFWVEGFLVKTAAGYRIFTDDRVASYNVPDNLTVVDLQGKTKTTTKSVPPGSRLKFYLNPAGNVVWSDYIWKAGFSSESRIALMSGASAWLMSGWEQVFITDKTTVFLETERRPYYDVKTGDLALVAGPSQSEILFVLVTERLSYVKVMNCVVGYTQSSQGRLGYELSKSSQVEPVAWSMATNLTLTYPAQHTNISFKSLNFGDRVKLWIEEGGDVVWGEIAGRNSLLFSGHYLGLKNGFAYLSGFSKHTIDNNCVYIGISGLSQLNPGAQIRAGGYGDKIDFIEVLENPGYQRYVSGTFLYATKDKIGIHASGLLQRFLTPSPKCFVDWKHNTDGSVTQLYPGDKVVVYVGDAQDVVIVERNSSPEFTMQGRVVERSGRVLVVEDGSTTMNLITLPNAVVVKNGELNGIGDIQKGDQVRVSGTDRYNVSVVVAGSY